MTEFEAWPKTPRLYRDVVITEKIDGTNAAIIVEDRGGFLVVAAQSRNRLITPDADNHGFATWVDDNAGQLAALLGPGRHFGEWWGSGIQRGYGLAKGEKRFSLFNTRKWADLDSDLVGVVPVLYEGGFSDWQVDVQLERLRQFGSYAAPGFMNPEGVCIFHTAAGRVFKVTLDNDGQPKSAVAA